MSINNFDVMKRMSDEDQDIRLAGLGNIISMKKVKAGTQITLGVQGDVLNQIATGVFGGCFLLYDWKQFQETRAKMEAEK